MNVCSHFQSQEWLHVLYVWVLCVFVPCSQWQRLCYTCRETVHLPVPEFSISCFPLCFKGDSDRGKHTLRRDYVRMCICVCDMPSTETERKMQTGVCSSSTKSASPTLLCLCSSRDELVPFMFPFLTSSLNNLLRCSSLSFELDRQSKDRLEQWGLCYRSALISNDWYFVVC